MRGDLLIGIVVTTILATIINESRGNDAGFTSGASWPSDVYETPDLALLGNFNFDAFTELAFISAIVWAFSLFLADFFDTMGTLVGVGKPAGYLDEDGRMQEIRKPLLVDSLAAVAGGAASTSSATTYIESASGVGVGGRTGWVAVVCGALFFPFMFFAPIIGMVPPQATAPALILVGFLMMSVLTEAEEAAEGEATGRKLAGIDFTRLAIGLGAALTIMFMPFTFSITDGIGMGFIAFVRRPGGPGPQARTYTPSCGSPRPRSSSTSWCRSSRTPSTGSELTPDTVAGMELAFLPATEQARLVREGEVSPLELVELYLERIERSTRARRLRHGLRRGGARRCAREDGEPAEAPFHGVPISLKDLDTTAGHPDDVLVARSSRQTFPTSTWHTSRSFARRASSSWARRTRRSSARRRSPTPR